MNPTLSRPLHIAARVVLAAAGSYWLSALAASAVPLLAGVTENAVYAGTILGTTLLPLLFLWTLAARRLRTVGCVMLLAGLLLWLVRGAAHG